MMDTWQEVTLGNVLTKTDEWADINPDQFYKQVTVRLWGKGVVLRSEVEGSTVAAGRQRVVRAGQFILSRIDARNGALGLVPVELDGAIVTNDFPSFAVDQERLLPAYLAWLSKTREFVRLCQAASEGTTNRVRLQEVRFLAMTIRLPPLAEQQRIVARIDALAARIEEAKGLRAQAVAEVEAACRAILFDKRNDLTLTPMRQLVDLRETDVSVEPDKLYQFAGVYSFGRGVFRSVSKLGSEFSYARLTRLSANDFVFPMLMAWEGAFGIVPQECAGCVVSPEFPVFRVNQERVLPEVLDFYFKTPATWPVVSGISTGTNVRRRRLNPMRFLDYDFPLPPMPTQHKLRQVTRQLEPVRRLQAETQAELDALLPAVLDWAFRGEL